MIQTQELLNHFQRTTELFERITRDQDFFAILATMADQVSDALRNGGKLLIAGNGGSAADAQHIAAEFVSRFLFDRRPLAALALTTDTSALTAIGNDYGFEGVFQRQIRALGKHGDVFLAISTSGRSPNILAAVREAQMLGIFTLGFTGASGSEMKGLCDRTLVVPSNETALVQQIHLTAAHALCGQVEAELCAERGPIRPLNLSG